MFDDEDEYRNSMTGNEISAQGADEKMEAPDAFDARQGDASVTGAMETEAWTDEKETKEAEDAEAAGPAAGMPQREDEEAQGSENAGMSKEQADGHVFSADEPAPRRYYDQRRASDGYAAYSQTAYREPGQKSRAEKKEKKNHLGLKSVGLGLLFGLVAGLTMFSVNTACSYISDRLSPKAEVAETSPAPVLQKAEPGEHAASGTTDVADIVEDAMPSVVAINNTTIVEQQTWFGYSQQYEAQSSGSGIIIGQNDDELLIVTNNHVVEDAKDTMVTFIDDTQVAAAIKGTDSESDLAVIAVALSDIPSETMDKIKVAVIGDSDELRVGEGVIAIGNALGYGQSVTVGYVSALNREIETQEGTVKNLLQTDAAINPGNSGGALLNMKGEVIGINAAKYSSTEVEGMGYAIPISKAQDIIDELMTKKTRTLLDESEQGYLGIQGSNIDSQASQMYDMPEGIYVFRIMEGSAAEGSELHEKDIITKFDGQSVRTMADLKDMLSYYAAGTEVELTVQSLVDGQYIERTVTIVLGKRTS